MTNLTIVLLTYNRIEYAKRTLESVLDELDFNGGLRVHIASDGDGESYIAQLTKICEEYDVPCASTNSERGGYGRNYNLATQAVHEWSDFVLPLEDDWELVREFSPVPLMRAMHTTGIGCMRLGYLGWTQDFRGRFISAEEMHFIEFDPASPEPHVFAGHPRLETVEFQRLVGPWPEGLSPGATEFAVAHIPAARRGVAWPLTLADTRGGDLFAHIGTIRSY